MKSLKLLEEINKILIDANKRCDIAFKNVGECDKVRGDLEHDLLNKYKDMKAKEKRKFTDELFESLVERHNQKYEFRELDNTPLKLETAINTAINKLRKLNQEQETPIYYKRASRNKGEKIIVKEIN